MGKEIYVKFLKRKKWYLIFLVLIIGAGVALASLAPYIFGELLDSVSEEKVENFKSGIIIYAILLFLAQVFSMTEALIGQWIVTSVENNMKSNLMEHILGLTSGSADEFVKGELINRLEFDVETIGDYYIDLISSILMIIVNLFISVYFIFYISTDLSVIAVLFFPLMYLVNFLFRGKVRRLGIEQKKIGDQYYSFLGCIFTCLNPIKTFVIQKTMQDKFERLLEKRFQFEMKNVTLISGISMLRSLLNNVLNVVLLTVAGMFIVKGEMSVGKLVAFNAYLEMLFEAISKTLELNLNKQEVIVSYKRICEINKKGLELEVDGEIILNKAIQNIKFQNVCFSYPCRESVLNGVEFLITSPGIYSLVGENGCGKTTILKLIERLYDVDGGQIYINEKNIKDYQIESVRKQMVYMEKEPFFVRGTIYENLCIGEDDISEMQIEEVCRMIGIHYDIMRMENQYHTIIEEGGINLSSGQKQKLGLARVFLKKNRCLYLLDEVTSDLDGGAEKKIVDILEEIANISIVLTVSHKEEILKRSKCILVIDNGKVIEQGTHRKLMMTSHVYQKLYNRTP